MEPVWRSLANPQTAQEQRARDDLGPLQPPYCIEASFSHRATTRFNQEAGFETKI
jgi:hypothetical protein